MTLPPTFLFPTRGGVRGVAKINRKSQVPSITGLSKLPRSG
jgi:hypothetical protein